MSTVREIIPRKVGKTTSRYPRTAWPFTRNLEEMLEGLFQRPGLEPLGWKRGTLDEFEPPFATVYPLVDLIDREKDLMVRAQVPGIRKDELDLTLMDDCLTIAVDREAKEEKKLERYYRCEMTHESFERTIFFPVEVDSDKAKAEMHDGILEIVIPKLKKVKKHTLKVQ